MAENLHHRGMIVTLIEASDHVVKKLKNRKLKKKILFRQPKSYLFIFFFNKYK
jgi:hypothetical protein